MPMSATFDRWWPEVLLAIDGQPIGVRTEMLVRAAVLFEVVADRRRWLIGEVP
jgi:hypothetical protein